jgi:hypothetical protein
VTKIGFLRKCQIHAILDPHIDSALDEEEEDYYRYVVVSNRAYNVTFSSLTVQTMLYCLQVLSPCLLSDISPSSYIFPPPTLYDCIFTTLSPCHPPFPSYHCSSIPSPPIRSQHSSPSPPPLALLYCEIGRFIWSVTWTTSCLKAEWR